MGKQALVVAFMGRRWLNHMAPKSENSQSVQLNPRQNQAFHGLGLHSIN